MAESLRIVPSATRASAYAQLLPQLRALTENERDLTANQANLSAALFAQFGFHWIGFYRVQDDELVLGPFQGPVACTRIGKGRGVCGTAWARGETIMVPDVDLFPGHIACSARSRSEIVVPYFDSSGAVGGRARYRQRAARRFLRGRSHLAGRGDRPACLILPGFAILAQIPPFYFPGLAAIFLRVMAFWPARALFP